MKRNILFVSVLVALGVVSAIIIFWSKPHETPSSSWAKEEEAAAEKGAMENKVRMEGYTEKWSDDTFAKFNRARVKLKGLDFWTDEKIASSMKDQDPDDPKVIAAWIEYGSRIKDGQRYTLPKDKAEKYITEKNTQIAYIFAAFASGTKYGQGEIDEYLLNKSVHKYGETALSTYAHLMTKGKARDERTIQRLKELSPESGIADVLHAAYLLKNGEISLALSALETASKKKMDNFGLQIQNEELAYRLSNGENIRDVLRTGSRVFNATETALFNEIDADLAYAAQGKFKQEGGATSNDWEQLAAYGAVIAEWRQNSSTLLEAQNSISRQMETMELLANGDVWEKYSPEPYAKVSQELADEKSRIKSEQLALMEFLANAPEDQLLSFSQLRVQVGERQALRSFGVSASK